jgi:hypothetical protein
MESETDISLSIKKTNRNRLIKLVMVFPIDDRSQAFYDHLSELDGSEDLQEIEVWAIGGQLKKLVAPE